ncbi:hypothetical protein DFH06DRAFT_1442091 [Mycena polygramma]|nr:hypothetical protein DFH06DRAFT_1442091 [Mycena polygramma]
MSISPVFSFSTTAEEVATAFADEMKGKNVLITGTSINGIGFETARVIAKYANLVVITGYNDERLKLSEEAIKAEVLSANIHRLTLDLSSLEGVRKAAAEVNAHPQPLHVLIHNAAAAMGPFKLTVDGLESQMATGHVGPFLLTKLLLPKLRSAASKIYTPRVVFVSGRSHLLCKGVDLMATGHVGPFLLTKLLLPKLRSAASKIYTPRVVFVSGRSHLLCSGVQCVDVAFQLKAANILAASEMARRGKGVIQCSPWISRLRARNRWAYWAPMVSLTTIVVPRRPFRRERRRTLMFTFKLLSASTVAAAFDPKIDVFSGAYLDDCAVATDKIAPHSADPVTAGKLWTVTEEVIGEKFSFED